MIWGRKWFFWGKRAPPDPTRATSLCLNYSLFEKKYNHSYQSYFVRHFLKKYQDRFSSIQIPNLAEVRPVHSEIKYSPVKRAKSFFLFFLLQPIHGPSSNQGRRLLSEFVVMEVAGRSRKCVLCERRIDIGWCWN